MSIDKPIILVSSTVYGIEDILNQLYATLRAYGYEVWMSHKGTVPVHPGRTAFENCLDAVDKCDVFLGIITPFYGSGRDENGMSITHRELQRAVERGALRWFLAHDHVAFARQLLRQYRFLDGETLEPNPNFTFRPTKVLDHIGVIEMYEAATLQEIPLIDRHGNWVQTYQRQEDALLFVSSQFADMGRIRRLLSGGALR